MTKKTAGLILFLLALAGLLLFAGQAVEAGSRLHPPPRPLFQINETEPNDSFGDADGVGDFAPGQIISGTLNPAGEDDFFRFAVTPGRQYRAELRPLTVSVLEMELYFSNQALSDSVGPSGSTMELFWTASDSTYYIRVFNDGSSSGTYRLFVSEVGTTPTPTETPTPSLTPTPTPTDAWDAYEPNNGLDPADPDPNKHPRDVSLGQTLENLNFWPFGAKTEAEANDPARRDVDVFRIWCKPGHRCRAATEVTSGVDTRIRIYADSAITVTDPIVAENDDRAPNDLGSDVTWTSSGSGFYKVYVENLDGSPRTMTGQTYTLVLEDVSPTATPTPTQTPTPSPGPSATPTSGPTANPYVDDYEPNYDFDHAAVIGLGERITGLNFAPWGGATEDNDFFKIWVKPGLLYVCETFTQSPGTDTNMILYDANRNGIAGNDDKAPGDYGSKVFYFSTYQGYLYILIGQVGGVRPEEGKDRVYDLECRIVVPGTPTPTPTSQVRPSPTARPAQSTATFTPVPPPTATPQESQAIRLRPLVTPTPPPATAGTSVPASPTPTLLTIELLLYYDGNRDGKPDVGEGITSIPVYVYDATTNERLARGYTDASGYLRFTVPASAAVRVSIPFFSFSQIVATDASIEVRIAPPPPPGGSP